MATPVAFNNFMHDLAEGVHDLDSNQLAVALTTNANAPAGANSTLSDLTEIAYTNLSSRNLTTSTSGVFNTNDYQLQIANLTLTASGGAVATFRHVSVYNDTATGDPLMFYLDLGSDITLADGDSITINFADETNGVFQIAA